MLKVTFTLLCVLIVQRQRSNGPSGVYVSKKRWRRLGVLKFLRSDSSGRLLCRRRAPLPPRLQSRPTRPSPRPLVRPQSPVNVQAVVVFEAHPGHVVFKLLPRVGHRARSASTSPAAVPPRAPSSPTPTAPRRRRGRRRRPALVDHQEVDVTPVPPRPGPNRVAVCYARSSEGPRASGAALPSPVSAVADGGPAESCPSARGWRLRAGVHRSSGGWGPCPRSPPPSAPTPPSSRRGVSPSTRRRLRVFVEAVCRRCMYN